MVLLVLKRGDQEIVDIGPALGLLPPPPLEMQPPVEKPEAGLVALSKTLAREHARHGITLNAVCPGPTETALLDDVVGTSRDPDKLREAFRRAIPMGRLGQPDDLAGIVAFLASDEAAYITGQVISVSGGLTMNG